MEYLKFQDPSRTVAIKNITKKSLAKSQNLLGKEIKILKVSYFMLHFQLVFRSNCLSINLYLNTIYLLGRCISCRCWMFKMFIYLLLKSFLPDKVGMVYIVMVVWFVMVEILNLYKQSSRVAKFPTAMYRIMQYFTFCLVLTQNCDFF